MAKSKKKVTKKTSKRRVESETHEKNGEVREPRHGLPEGYREAVPEVKTNAVPEWKTATVPEWKHSTR